ncbi:MAG: translocation/assembly module TamB, partial [Saprospiraceae bacterium]|nr:translocation/assembly module TamB [Saprospiraceae bacterium]
RHLGRIQFQGKASGGLQELVFDQLDLETDAATAVSLTGVVRHLNDAKRLEGDLEIHALKAHADDLTGIISDTLQSTLSNFGLVTYNGVVKGDLKNLFLKGHADTEIGCLEADLDMVFSDDHKTGRYSGVLAMEQFRIGQMIGDPELDWITFRANGDGSGFTLNDLEGKVNLEIDSFLYRQYVYHDLTFSGQIERGKLNGLISSKDPNLGFDFEGLIDFTDSIPLYSFEMQLENADLNATNLVEQDLQIGGFVKAEGRGSNFDDLLGNISFQNVYLKSDSLMYQADNLSVSASQDQGSRSISLAGDDFEVVLDGQFQLSLLALSVREALSRYYTLEGIDSLDRMRISGVPQNFKFALRFFDPMPFKIFLPELNTFDSVVIEGRFMTERPEIDFNAVVTNISYQDFYSDSLVVDMVGREHDLHVGLSARALQIKKIAEYPSVNFNGHIKNDSIDWDIAASADSIGRKIWVDGTLTRDGDLLQLTLQDSLRAGGYLWSLDKANQILYRPGYILVDHLSLQHLEQKISVQSGGTKTKPEPLTVKFDDFELRALTDLAGLGGGNFSGRISGSFDLLDLFQDPWYRADLQVDNLTMLDTILGDLTLKARQSPANNQVEMNVMLTGSTNQAMANFIYFPKQKSIQGGITLDRAEMRLVDPFVDGILRDNKGIIAGNLQVEGSLDAIDVVGKIDLKEASTVVEINSSRYRIPDHSILIDDNAIELASMRIVDDNGYEATLKGKIYHNLMRDFVLDLELITDQFQFLNTTQEDNPTFHGKLMLDASVSARGPVRQPEVQVRARTLNGSNFTMSTFVESQEVSGPDYILFGNPMDQHDDSLVAQSYQVTNSFPFRATVTLEATEEAQFTFIVDPESGDHLSCRGSANLILEFQPSGHISIYGQYNVTSGTYFFSYGDLIKRNFSLQPGSTVTFSGDPLNARFNL